MLTVFAAPRLAMLAKYSPHCGARTSRAATAPWRQKEHRRSADKTGMGLTPEISGRVGIQSPTAGFLAAFQQRVAAGLLAGQPHPRSKYRVVSSAPDGLTVQAADWWTAVNVGLNDVELRLSQPGSVQYRVRYWRWARFGFYLCGVLGLTGIMIASHKRPLHELVARLISEVDARATTGRGPSPAS